MGTSASGFGIELAVSTSVGNGGRSEKDGAIRKAKRFPAGSAGATCVMGASSAIGSRADSAGAEFSSCGKSGLGIKRRPNHFHGEVFRGQEEILWRRPVQGH